MRANNALVDMSARSLPVASADFQGIGSRPTLTGVASTGPNTVLVSFSKSMSDDSINPLSYHFKSSGGASLFVLGARFLGSERRVVELTTMTQENSDYIVEAITAVDLESKPLLVPADASLNHFAGRLGIAAPALVKAIPTSSTRIVLTFTGAVGDSALAPSTYLINQLDAQGNTVGTLQINRAAFVGGQRTVIELETAPQAQAWYQVSTNTTFVDVAGSRLAQSDTLFQGLGTRPTLSGVVSTGPASLLITFSEPMNDNVLTPGSYQIKDAGGSILPAVSARFIGTERRVVELTTLAQNPVVYTVESIHAADVDGNKLVVPADPAINQFSGRLGAAAPVLIKAIPTSSTRIVLTFSGAVGDSALAASSYLISRLDAQGNPVGSLQINRAAFVGGQHTVVELETAPQSQVGYQISTTSALTDLAGSKLAVVSTSFQGLGTRPVLTGVVSTGPITLLITFSEPMNDNVLTPGSYQIKDAGWSILSAVSARFIGTERRVVELTTLAQNSAVYAVESINASDLDGNKVVVPADPAINQFSGRLGAAAPVLIKAIPTSSTRIVLTFSGAVGDSALAASSYLISQLDAQGNSIGTLQITRAAFVGGQRTVVELVTLPQSQDWYQVETNSALVDLSGSKLADASSNFLGLGTRPALTGVVSTGPNTLLVSFSEPMSDDILSPLSYRITDSSSNALLTAVSASFVGTERRVVELTTLTQSQGSYTVNSINASDLEGNKVAVPADPAVNQFTGRMGVAASTLIKAVPTSSTRLVLTFTGAVGDSALAPSSYLINKLDSQGNVIGSLPIKWVAFVGSQRTVLELETTPQDLGNYQISTTTALVDMSGTKLPASNTVFQGIGSRPTLTGVASTGIRTVLVSFSKPVSDDALSPVSYTIKNSLGRPLIILGARFLGTERRLVELTSLSQSETAYHVEAIMATDTEGNQVNVPSDPALNTFTGGVETDETPDIAGPPRVVGAASISNTEVIVAFSEPMANNALLPVHYVISQQNVNTEVGKLIVTDAEFYLGNPSVVKLTTLAQNELTYRVAVVNATDQAGNALAAKFLSNDSLVDPASANFRGTPPKADSNGNLTDTDGDGLPDSEEQRGYLIHITRLDGTVVERAVTSDPTEVDTDGDGLPDYLEASIGTDPRSKDTDTDQIGDYAEYNEIYSNTNDQDSDKDGLDDFLEWGFFRTSPVFADTDGDQIKDGNEIIGNRNPLVSDLPRPEISVGDINLQLDVKFTETKDTQKRELESRQVSTTLASSNNQSHSKQYTANIGVKLNASSETTTGKDAGTKVTKGAELTAGFTYQATDTTTLETSLSYANSLNTDKEVTAGFNVVREVQGASMKVAVSLRNLSNLAYRVKNIQVTAFIQDPQDHSRLTPVATLLPDAEPAEGYTLGMLSSDRGPFIFSNTTIIPKLVESLMANSTGLIFRISNYDIIDESGRNFAFTSQEVVERTSSLVIDFGGSTSLVAKLSGTQIDPNKPGDETEIYRVSTSAGRTIDTNNDGNVDQNDHRVSFDAAGKEVGINAFDALAAVGLKHYEAVFNTNTGKYEEFEPGTTTPVSLTYEQKLASYATYQDETIDRIYRIRGVSNDSTIQKYWQILTPLGIDKTTDLKDLILKSSSQVSLNFVQDLDGDSLPTDVEYFLGTSDSPDQMQLTPVPNTTNFIDEHGYVWGNPTLPTGFTPSGYVDSTGFVFDDSQYNIITPKGRDTDGDGLDDRFEALIGWTVDTTLNHYKVFSSPRRSDSNFDRLSDYFTAPGDWDDKNNNHFRDQGEVDRLVGGEISPPSFLNLNTEQRKTDYVLDPIKRDTDGDGINDVVELKEFEIIPITGAASYTVKTDPSNRDTDGDTFSDGFEKQVGLNPTDGNDKDSDGDGLPDPVETTGWYVTTYLASSTPYQRGVSVRTLFTSDRFNPDTDDDGIGDFEEFVRKLNPRTDDSDSDGISDQLEFQGFKLPHEVNGKELGIITTDPYDADTDHDMRSDGSEAELKNVEQNAWVVRLSGAPYRVYSNPIIADADFDGIVDGMEFAFSPSDSNIHSDPNNSNTDRDNRDDGVEYFQKTNPLVKDISVTIVAKNDWTTNGTSNLKLDLYRPDYKGTAGISDSPENFFTSSLNLKSNLIHYVEFNNNAWYDCKLQISYVNPNGGSSGTITIDDRVSRGGTRGYDLGVKGNGAILEGALLSFSTYVYSGDDASNATSFYYTETTNNTSVNGPTAVLNATGYTFSSGLGFSGINNPISGTPQYKPISNRSITFGLAEGESFSIGGSLINGISTLTSFGGLEGLVTDPSTTANTVIRSVFSYSTLTTSGKKFFDYQFTGTAGYTYKMNFYIIVG